MTESVLEHWAPTCPTRLSTVLVTLGTDGEARWCDQDTRFDASSPQSASLATDEEVEAALGQALWLEDEHLRNRVVHWLSGHLLLAIVDRKTWKIGIRRMVRKEALIRTRFVERPEGAYIMTDGLRQGSIHDALWQFGQLGAHAINQVPEFIWTEPLMARRAPALASAQLQPRHQHILRLLKGSSATFEQLRSALAAPAEDLQHDIASLYYTHSVDLAEVLVH